ncbi:MAG: hypothetical protein IT365_11205 [Candidatus Hydrogenedentes bacterium]|nr:hypothetical protein [Candidatus Hydrogenedentota bacterium]
MATYVWAAIYFTCTAAGTLHGTVEAVPKSNVLKITSNGESGLYVLYGVKAAQGHLGAEELAIDCISSEVLDADVAFDVVRENGRLRHVRVTTASGEDLSTLLIQNGIMTFAGYGLECDEQYRESEAKAKAALTGIWAPPQAREWSSLQISEDGRTVSYVEKDGSVVIKSQGNFVPNAEVRQRAAQEADIRMEQRREAIALRKMLEAEAAEQRAEEAKEAYLRNLLIYTQYRARPVEPNYPQTLDMWRLRHTDPATLALQNIAEELGEMNTPGALK